MSPQCRVKDLKMISPAPAPPPQSSCPRKPQTQNRLPAPDVSCRSRQAPPTPCAGNEHRTTLPPATSTATGAVNNCNAIPSRSASSISQALAGISSRERRYTITTSSAPKTKRRARRVNRRVPPPITITRFPYRRHFPATLCQTDSLQKGTP